MQTKLRVNTKAKENKSVEIDEELEPVSPTTEYFLTDRLTLYILCFFELEIPVDFPSIYARLHDVFLQVHPRFSSIPVEDKKGKKKWKRIEVNIKDHVKVPVFVEDLSTEDYTKHYDDYVSEIATSKVPQDKPLWELHIFNYPTKNAAATLIFKFHHAIADGTSLMGVVLACIRRTDDPSKPLTFPSRTTSRENKNNHDPRKTLMKVFNSLPTFITSIFYSLHYFGQSLRLLYSEDDRTPIKSGITEISSHSRTYRTLTLSLIDVKRIKTLLGVSVNDVVVGVIFLGIRLYMREMNNGQIKNSRSTLVITLNARSNKSYASPEEMREHNTKVPWGNRFSVIELSIPNLEEGDFANPLKFILKAHKIIKKKRKTPFAQILLGAYLGAVRACGGLEAAVRTFDRRADNCSILMTNMIGPTEKMSITCHPVKGFYFMPAGLKSTFTVSVMSYMQMLTIGLAVGRDFIDQQKLTTSVEKAFQLVFEAAIASSNSTAS